MLIKMGKFRKTLNLLMLVVLLASNFLTPISYATADLESWEDTSQIVDASENVGDTYDITGGGGSLTNLGDDEDLSDWADGSEEKETSELEDFVDDSWESDTQWFTQETQENAEDAATENAKTDTDNTVLDDFSHFSEGADDSASSTFRWDGENSLEQNGKTQKTADDTATQKAKTDTDDTVLDYSFQTVGEEGDNLTSSSSLLWEEVALKQSFTWDMEALTWEVEELTWSILELTTARENLNIDTIEKSEKYNKVTVNVKALSGTFPEGTELNIEPVKWNKLEDVKQQISGSPTNNLDEDFEIVAFNITFVYKLSNGEEVEVQPLSWQSVQVTFDYSMNNELKQADKDETQEIQIYHINDKDDNWDKVSEWEEVTEKVEINEMKSEEIDNVLVVDAEKFSIYAIIKTNIPESVTVHYNAWEGAFTWNVSNVDIVYTLNNWEYVADKATQQPSQDGYSFRWWYTSNSCTTRWNGIVDDTTTPEVTVYACYLPFSDITKTFGRFSFTMMDRNLWATSTTNYWYLYQWWNNYGFWDWETPAVSEDLVATNTYNSQPWWPEDYYSSSNFISRQNSPFRWDNADIRNLWWGTSDSQTDWQGPCPDGYHVPNSAEWVAVYESYIASWNLSKDFGTNLWLPMAWYRNNYWAWVTDAWNQWRYWASNALDWDSAYALTFTTSSATANDTKYRTYWNSVRCFKNTDKVNITFNSNGWSTVTGQTFDWYEARTQSLKPVPTKAEENFAWWYYDSELTQIFNWSDNKYVTEDTTLYAKWWCEPWYVLNNSNECVLRQVTVTYKKWNSTRATATYVRNTDGYYMSTTQVQPPKESWKMFDQWYLDTEFTQLWKYPEDNDGLWENITVYAKFLPFEDKTVDLWDISLVLMDRNLWAVDTSEWYWDATADNIWYYYQFWNNYGFPNVGVWTNTYQWKLTNIWTTLSRTNMYSNWLFVLWSQRYFTDTQSYNNLWWWYSANTNPDSYKVWPCPDGYHIPENTEWSATFNKFKTWKSTEEWTTYCAGLSNWECFAKALWLPFGGLRLSTTSNIDEQWSIWYYWASSYRDYTNWYWWKLSQSNFETVNKTHTTALNLRCFKNTDQYTLTFNSMWWSDVVAQKIWWWKPYSTVTPTRVWSIFSGWYLDTWYENKFDGTVSANTTVYAKWECSNGYQMDSEGNCVKDTYISVKYVANPSTFPGGKFPGWESQKTIEYRLTVWWYFAAHEEIQVPNLAWNYMFEWWYTDTSYTPASRWTWLNSTTTYSDITLYARYLPFNDKTIDFWWVSITIMDRNLWALDYSSWYSYNNTQSTSVADGVATRIWNYYQWWNNFWFPNKTNGWNGAYPNSDTTNMVVNYWDTAWWPGNYYFNGKFIRRPDSPYRWDDADNLNLWWWNWETESKANADTDKQWPCPNWYHVPGRYEWVATKNLFDKWSITQAWDTYCNSLTNSAIQYCMPAVLGLPFAGLRLRSSAGVYYQGARGYYWSSSRFNANYAYYLNFGSTALSPQDNRYRAYGFSVRCFKNSPSLTLTFDSNGGSSVASQTNFKWWNPRSSKPANPTRAKSTFKGWFLDDGTFTEEFTFSSTTYVSESKTLHAKWECDEWYSMSEDGQKCESVPVVTFNATANGGSTSRPIASFREWTTVHLEEYTATKPGWDFVWWNTNQTAKTAMDNFVIWEDGVRLYAIFKRDLVATFDINGNDSLTLNSNTVTTNITWSCAVWNKETSCSVKAPYITSANTPRVLWFSHTGTSHEWTYLVNSNITISEDTTFYAQTIKDEVDRMITFNPNGNTSFTYGWDTQTSAKDYVLCTIPASYNGVVQSDSCTETITFPNITPSGEKTVLWWSTWANITDNLILTWASQTLTATKNLTYYAQSQSDWKTLTVTFYGNGATISWANSWQTTCSIAPEFNGWVQATQCDVDVPIESTVSRAWFSIYGYDTNENAHSATYPTSTNKITVSADTSLYVISNKQLSVRFYKNGNDAQTQNGQSITDTSEYVSENCYVRNNATSCDVITPTISSENTPTILWYSTSPTNHVAVVGQNSLLSISDETPYYAQSKKESKSINISFYVNWNQWYNYSGTDYVEDSTHALCTIEEVYNGTEQSPTCNKSITFPTITAPDNTPTVLWWTDWNDNHTAQYTAWQTATVTAWENLNFFAQTTSPAIVLRGTFSTWVWVQSIAYNSGTCTISAIYNGNDWKAQKESCSIVFPTFELKQWYENPVWRSSLWDQNANTTTSLPITANTSFTLIGDTASYSITYDKLGWILTDEKTSYTVEDNDFTLKTPTKRWYEFLWWTGSNWSTPQKTVVVHKWTHWNLNYTANWRLATYTITYHLYNWTVDGTNPTEYSVETELFTLIDPTKIWHTFAWWTGTNLNSPTTPVTIRKWTVWDLEFFANYTKNLYEVTLTYTPSTGGSVDWAGTYEYGESVTVTANPDTWYHFVSWLDDEDNVVSTDNPYVFMADESWGTGLKAVFELNEYNVTVATSDENKGTVNSEVSWTYRYWKRITLIATAKQWYRFDRWTKNNTTISTNTTVEVDVTEAMNITGHFVARDDTPYTVKHWKQNINDNDYTEVVADEQPLSWTTNTQTSATSKSYEWFTPQTITQLPINADWNTVVNVYYTRNSYDVIYNFSNTPDGHSVLPATQSHKYWKTVSVAWLATAPWYTFSWNTDSSFTMPAHAVTITGTFTAKPDTPYTIEYYYQKSDWTYPTSPNFTWQRLGTTDTETGVIASDQIPDISMENYVYDATNSDNITTTTIKWDESWLLKIYFKKQYTVEYNPWTKWTFTGEVINWLDYNANTPSPTVDTWLHQEWYTFNWWSPAISNKVTENKTYTAQWIANEYVVNFDNNGWSWSMKTESMTYDDSKALSENAFTKAWYTFLWWDVDSDATTPTYTWWEIVSNLASNSWEVVTLYAIWDANTDTPYTVYYYLENADNDNYSLNSTDDTKVWTTDSEVLISTLEKEITWAHFEKASLFVNPQSTEDLIDKFTIDGNGNTEVYLFYKRNTHTVTATTWEWVGSVSWAWTYKYGATVTLTPEDVNPCYTATAITFIMPDSNVEKVLSWTIKSFTVTLEKDSNTNSVQWAGTYNCWDEVTVTATPKSWYSFARWNSEDVASSTSNPYTFTMPDKAVSIQAQSNANTYTVNFNANGWIWVMSPQQFTYDVSQELSNNLFTKTWYIFTWWSTNPWATTSTYTNMQNVDNLATSWSITLYAVWTTKWTNTKYTVRHIKQGLSTPTDDVIVEEELYAETNSVQTPAVNTYPWFNSPSSDTLIVAPNGDASIDYVYTRKDITLTLNNNNGAPNKTITWKYWAEVQKPTTNPTKNGYTFVSWTPSIPDNFPTTNETYTAQYTLDTYTINYNLNGGVNNAENPLNYTYLSWDIVLRYPTRDWFVFNWWTWTAIVWMSKDVTIPAHSEWNRGYTAIWWEDKNNNWIDDITELKYTVKFLSWDHWNIAGKLIYKNVLSWLTLNDLDFVEPTKTPDDNYMFSGWNLEINPSAKITWDITYIAIWWEDVNHDWINDANETKYTVTINYVYSRWWTATWSYTTWNQLSGFTYNVASPNITYYHADKTNVSGTVTWNVVETVTYAPNIDTNGNGIADELETKHKVTVNYEYSRWGTATWSVSGMYLSGIAFNFISPDIENYHADKAVVNGTWTEENQTFKVTYTPNHDENHDGYADEWEDKYTVTINYVYSRWWTATWSYTTWNQLSGFTYNVASPNITYYHADKTNVSGTVTWNVVETVTYAPNIDTNGNGIADELETKHKVTVNYEYSRWGTATWSVSGMYLSGIAFNFISPDIENYHADKAVVNGTWTEENQTFKVTYTPNHDTNGNGVADEEESLNSGWSWGSSSSYSWSWRRVAKSVNNIKNHWVSEENKEQNWDNASVESKDNQWDTTQNIWNNTNKSEVIITSNNRKMYSEEVIDAYTWAYANDITTINSFEKATPNKVMIRWHMAKVVVNYMVNVLWKEMPKDIPAHCKWNDKEKDWGSKEMKSYWEKACALWIMWINTKKFQPKKTVSRAEFWTILSRILWWDKYNIDNPTKDKPYYINHLKSLKENWIMKQIDNPRRDELREWVWVMLRRTTKK